MRYPDTSPMGSTASKRTVSCPQMVQGYGEAPRIYSARRAAILAAAGSALPRVWDCPCACDKFGVAAAWKAARRSAHTAAQAAREARAIPKRRCEMFELAPWLGEDYDRFLTDSIFRANFDSGTSSFKLIRKPSGCARCKMVVQLS
jgi:hypothetical protein